MMTGNERLITAKLKKIALEEDRSSNQRKDEAGDGDLTALILEPRSGELLRPLAAEDAAEIQRWRPLACIADHVEKPILDRV